MFNCWGKSSTATCSFHLVFQCEFRINILALNRWKTLNKAHIILVEISMRHSIGLERGRRRAREQRLGCHRSCVCWCERRKPSFVGFCFVLFVRRLTSIALVLCLSCCKTRLCLCVISYHRNYILEINYFVLIFFLTFSRNRTSKCANSCRLFISVIEYIACVQFIFWKFFVFQDLVGKLNFFCWNLLLKADYFPSWNLITIR